MIAIFLWIYIIAPQPHAGVAQLVEQLICNQQVAGSSPIASLIKSKSYNPIFLIKTLHHFCGALVGQMLATNHDEL